MKRISHNRIDLSEYQKPCICYVWLEFQTSFIKGIIQEQQHAHATPRLKLITAVIALVCILSSCRYQQPSTKLAIPGFPFTIEGEAGSIVFISPEFYNQKNLESLFLWHYKKHLNSPYGAPNMYVFTSKERMNAYIQDLKKPYGESERHYPDGKPTPSPSQTFSPPRRSLSDAEFSQAPSHSIWKKNEDITSSGYNVIYRFAPDLTQPKIWKTVVLRGSTWTEGKYNTQSQDFPGLAGKINIISYDLYNVEPPSRYYTFSYKTIEQFSITHPEFKYKSGEYESTRILFNLRLDNAVLPSVNQVNVLKDKVVYAYMGWLYSVTTDGGQTWHLWDAERTIPEWKCCDPGLIREVRISPQGDGVLTLRINQTLPEKLTILYTMDFGQHWGHQ